MCSVAWLQTDGQTDRHESDYCGHPFRVSEFFLQPIIKDRPNMLERTKNGLMSKFSMILDPVMAGISLETRKGVNFQPYLKKLMNTF